jgi:cardiolipin synthase
MLIETLISLRVIGGQAGWDAPAEAPDFAWVCVFEPAKKSPPFETKNRVVVFFSILVITGLLLQLLLVVLALFEPGPAYRIVERPVLPLDSKGFARMLAALSDSEMHGNSRVDVLTNGDVFYEAELEAIAKAQSHICMEAYLFQKGEVARSFINALTERARAGIQVRLVLDAVGSFNTWPHTFRDLIDAGGQVCWYMPLRWYNLSRYNSRTHRELLVVDGAVGFIGGAGIGDQWLKSRRRRAKWRDTMFRVEGRAVSSLQSMFSENWLESSGELLTGTKYYPLCEVAGSGATIVINSSPSAGRSTRARMLFQTLIACAQRSIDLTTPYFLPDRSARQEMIRAVEERGVQLRIVVPGKHNDHLLTRRSSRRLYGDLLRHGAQIYEYQPAMIHTKSLVVDGVWSVVGSTNFDQRSFGLNDEVNLAALDEKLAGRLEQDFQADLAHSRRITYQEWQRRPLFERLHELLGWILERQE